MPVYEGMVETNDSIAQNGHSISYQDLCDIVRARVEELIRLIMLELPRNETASLVPAGLVLTGGTSNLSGIDALGRDITQLPVRIGMPVDIYGISEVLHNPAYATSVGLLLWGMKPESTSAWKKGMLGGGLRSFMSRIRRLFG
jgi:cell division protein FtsA